MGYTMKTTGVFEHSHGVFWEADLLLDGRKIGRVEQEGRGGADSVWVDAPYRKGWQEHCALFAGGEERATYLLLCAEEGVEPDSVFV
jgi:hypothetical protein